MKRQAEFDLLVFGASGFTGRLVAEHFARRYGDAQDLRWAMAGRSLEKLAEAREAIEAPAATTLIEADITDPRQARELLSRTRAILTTAGPYQLYGSELVAACADTGTDYLDLSGEVNWMRRMIDAHGAAAKKSGARILFSCGFDSIPFELGVFFVQKLARIRLGAPAPLVKGRVRAMRGGLSGGTTASARASAEAASAEPALATLMADPFALTPGFSGPAQPEPEWPAWDDDVGMQVGPFMMAAINTRNVHRSNLLQGHAYGKEFTYDEQAAIVPGAPTGFFELGALPIPPGAGPSREEREAGFYELAFIGVGADGRKVRAAVRGDRDPGYGSTSKMIAETAMCLLREGDGVAGGIWTPGAALGSTLIDRLSHHAGLTFTEESYGAASS